MLQTPFSFSQQKAAWKKKIRSIGPRVSTGSFGSNPFSTPDRAKMPYLSSSPSSTPSSSSVRDSDSFLTPLEVIDSENYHYLLENQVGLCFGDVHIPPPPPRRSPMDERNSPFSTASRPKVRPYVTSSKKSSDSVPPKQSCSICNERLQTKLDSEHLVQLECGDCVHGECLAAKADFLLQSALERGALTRDSPASSVQSVIFSRCTGDRCVSEGEVCHMTPISEDVVSKLMADAVLSVKLSSVAPKSSVSSEATAVEDDRIRDLRMTPLESHSENSLVYGSDNRVSRYFVKDNCSIRPKSDVWNVDCDLSFDRDSTYCSNPVTEGNKAYSLEDIKNIFIKSMLRQYANFDLALLVSLGNLRLVDKLHVAWEADQFTPRTVYLFSNFIIVESDGDSPHLFPLNEGCVLTTPETGVLQFVNGPSSLRLHSQTGSVIEKWGIAVSDVSLVLPSALITSSISVADLECKKTRAKPRISYPRAIQFPSSPAEQSSVTTIVGHSIAANLTVDDSCVISPQFLEGNQNAIGVFDLQKELEKLGVVPELTERVDSPVSPLNVSRKDSKDSGLSQISLSVDDSDDSDSDSDSELIRNLVQKSQKAC